MKKMLLLPALLFFVTLYADGAATYKKCSNCHGAEGEKGCFREKAKSSKI